jgi:hypothetical protein
MNCFHELRCGGASNGLYVYPLATAQKILGDASSSPKARLRFLVPTPATI